MSATSHGLSPGQSDVHGVNISSGTCIAPAT